MFTPPRTAIHRRVRDGRTSALLALAAVVALSSGLALAATSSPRLRTATNSKLGETIVVDSAGRTVYPLSPETRAHLLCTSKACLSFGPPVTVPSSKSKIKAAAGVKGKLALVRRSDGRMQITLAGSPLYRFAPDGSTPGAAGGQGVQSFGGTWHVIKAAGSSSTTNSNTMMTGTSAPSGY